MDMHLKGKTVLITGASQGIGAGLAESFAAQGCNLILVARSGDKLRALSDSILSRHKVQIKNIIQDLTETGAVEKIAEQAANTDILVNNAGNIPGGNLWDVDAQRWREGWQLKVFGYIDMTRIFYTLMKARGGGVILNNIGMAAEAFDFDYVAGTTGNAALVAFTRAVGGKSLQDNIRVVGVNPGPVATERIEKIFRNRAEHTFGDASRGHEFSAQLPLGRPASVPELTELFVFLASPHSAYTSGVVFTVDGGIAAAKSIV
jgi:NAD(P)-dependent dehydrogenase (short-subunit alcohol dehydrogenase family)